jgi:DNA adenine methylase
MRMQPFFDDVYTKSQIRDDINRLVNIYNNYGDQLFGGSAGGDNLRSFFGRIGSKRKILNKILKLIPSHMVYGEPFVGGGSVYFGKEPAPKEYINDLDKSLIEGYRLLKNAPPVEELLKYAIKSKTGDKDAPETIKKIQSFVNRKPRNNAERLLRKLYISRNTFGNRWTGFIYKGSTHIPKIKKIDQYRERLQNTTITNQDYKTFIKKIDSKDTFFYLDPPYEDSDKLYKFDFVNLEEMRDILKNIKGKFLLSINDSPNVRRIFKGFKIRTIVFKGFGDEREEKTIGSKDRRELLISNY